MEPKTLQELLDKIRELQTKFSPGQKLVAAYVVANSYKIPFLSITQLAKNIGVSENTIIKFCNQLGYAKFGQFKRAFSDFAHQSLVMTNELPENRKEDVFTHNMEVDMASIRSTLTDPCNHNALEKLLDMIDNAQSIYITGGRASGYMAGLFTNALRYLGLKVYAVEFGMGDYWDKLSIIDKKDLVIAISLPKYTAGVVDVLRRIHQLEIPLALITDTGLSPALGYADPVFHCDVESGYYFPCYAGCLALISTICRAVDDRRQGGNHERLTRLERELMDQGVFL